MISVLRKLALKIAEAALVLFGVLMVLFFLFYVIQDSDDQTDQPSLVSKFTDYSNDLSPLSFTQNEQLLETWNPLFQINLSETFIVFKLPYLGRSGSANLRVFDVIKDAIPETLSLIISVLIIALFVGGILGVILSRTTSESLRSIVRFLTSTGLAIPSFVVGILFAWLFGYFFSSYTGLNLSGSLFTYDVYASADVLTLHNIILPAFSLAIRPIALIAQLVESKLNEIYAQDFIRTARSKGLEERAILWRHALPNAFPILLTSIGSWFVSLIVGAVFVEYIFGWKGMGHLIINAIEYKDFKLIIGITLVVSLVTVVVNMLLEVLYPILEPSLRKS